MKPFSAKFVNKFLTFNLVLLLYSGYLEIKCRYNEI